MDILKRFMIGLGAMVMALGSSFTTMEGGATLTLSQIGQVPLMAWLFSLGTFIAGALNSADLRVPKLAATSTMMVLLVLLIVPLAGCETAQVIKEASPEAKPQTFLEHLAGAYGEVGTVRKLAAFYARSKLPASEDCQNNFSTICNQAREVDKQTRLFEQQLDRIWDAYLLVEGKLEKCTIEWQGQSFPCESKTDQIISGLITLRGFVK